MESLILSLFFSADCLNIKIRCELISLDGKMKGVIDYETLSPRESYFRKYKLIDSRPRNVSRKAQVSHVSANPRCCRQAAKYRCKSWFPGRESIVDPNRSLERKSREKGNKRRYWDMCHKTHKSALCVYNVADF